MRLVIFGATAVATGTVATGLAIRRLHGGLGTATPPFVAKWAPAPHPSVLVSLLVAAAGAWAAPRLMSARLPRPAFAVGVLGLALALGLSINFARHGVGGWARIFDTGPGGSAEAKNEYLPGLPALSYGVRFYLDRFAELVPSAPVNVAGHPPGPLLLLHLLGITTPAGLAALCIGVGAMSAPLTYALGTTLVGEAAGRRAALLCAASPLTLLFGVTSMDFISMTLGTAAACLLVSHRARVRTAGAAALAIAALFSWALLAIGAWSTLVVARRDGQRSGLRLAAGCAAATIALNAALAAIYGYNPIGTLQATEGVYRHSLAAIRPYAFWVLGSPVAWGVMLGAPIVVPALAAMARGRPAAVALAIVIDIAAAGGFTKAETERIWLFLVPPACVAAASELAPARLRVTLALLPAQAVAVQVLFDTVW